MASSRSRKLSPMALLAVLLVAAAAGLAFLFFPASEPETVTVQDDNPQQVSDDRQELTLSARRVDESMEEVLPLPEVEETTPSLEVTVTDTADDDSHRLPPEISLEGLTVGRSDDSQRVVVPSDVVDAMITEQELGGSGEKAVAEAPKNVASTPVTSEPTAAVPEVQAEASRKKANLGGGAESD